MGIMTENTIYIVFVIIALAIIGLLILFLKVNSKIEAKSKLATDYAKLYTNNKVTALDRTSAVFSPV